jgi:hypothetical protein
VVGIKELKNKLAYYLDSSAADAAHPSSALRLQQTVKEKVIFAVPMKAY